MLEKANNIIEELELLVLDLNDAKVDPDILEKQKQLQAVEKSIDQMERMGVKIPDEIRSFKSKLLTDLESSNKIESTKKHLVHELIQILKDLDPKIDIKYKERKRGKRSSDPVTSLDELADLILLGLKRYGGKAKSSEIMDWIADKNHSKFTPRDFSTLRNGVLTWQNNVYRARRRLLKKGILKSNSVKSTWELA